MCHLRCPQERPQCRVTLGSANGAAELTVDKDPVAARVGAQLTEPPWRGLLQKLREKGDTRRGGLEPSFGQQRAVNLPMPIAAGHSLRVAALWLLLKDEPWVKGTTNNCLDSAWLRTFPWERPLGCRSLPQGTRGCGGQVSCTSPSLHCSGAEGWLALCGVSPWGECPQTSGCRGSPSPHPWDRAQEAAGRGHLAVKPPEPGKPQDCLPGLLLPSTPDSSGGSRCETGWPRRDTRGRRTHSVTLTCSGGMA